MPVIADRDRLPLLQLLQGAGLSARFVEAERAILNHRTAGHHQKIRAITAQREAVACALTLPSWWHVMPSRRLLCPNVPRRKGWVETSHDDLSRPLE
jgi:hypothetical protein